MINVSKPILLFVSLCLCTSVFAQGTTPAFPEAQGFGAFTKGGRGGEVFIVTTTEDYDENEPVVKGSFREAVEADIPRTIVFEVSGIIELKRPLKIEHPNITIAGQTAPGDGICLKDYSFSVCADEAIVRYLRVRLGDVHRLESDAIDIGSVVDNSGQLSDIPSSNVIVDHCSASWATDEIFTIGSVEIEMILVEAGTFMMGSPDDEPGRFANERQHEVTISKPYYLAATALTTEQYYEVMKPNNYDRKYSPTIKKDSKPAGAPWHHAVKYMELLSLHSGYKYRMPRKLSGNTLAGRGQQPPISPGKVLPVNMQISIPGSRALNWEPTKLPRPFLTPGGFTICRATSLSGAVTS